MQGYNSNAAHINGFLWPIGDGKGEKKRFFSR